MLQSCKVTFKSYADFSSYCTAGQIDQWSLIGDLTSNFKAVGIFGNSNVDNNQDWVDAIVKDIDLISGTIDDARQSCYKTSSLTVEILFSKVGVLDDLQNYVVGAQISTSFSTWFYSANSQAN